MTPRPSRGFQTIKGSLCVSGPGEVLGDILSVINSPKGLRQLVNLPAGSGEAALGGVLPLAQAYQYLETTRTWDLLGGQIQKKSADLIQKIKEGEETLMET